METIGKILSLTLLAIFGTAGTVIYFTDPANSPSFVNERVTDSRQYESETDGAIDYSAYREQLRKNYFETKQSSQTSSGLGKQDSLWTNSYDTPSSEARKLAGDYSIGELRESMNYWNDRYHKALLSEGTVDPNEAYIKYQNYKKALNLKEAFK